LFVCIDLAYNVFERDILANASQLSARTRQWARRRSLLVLAAFIAAMLVALLAPRVGFGLICAALLLHLSPEVPGAGKPRQT
jgi:Na+/proline symporter